MTRNEEAVIKRSKRKSNFIIGAFVYLVQRGQNERKEKRAGKQLKLSGMKKLLSKLCHVEGNRGKKRAKTGTGKNKYKDSIPKMTDDATNFRTCCASGTLNRVT